MDSSSQHSPVQSKTPLWHELIPFLSGFAIEVVQLLVFLRGHPEGCKDGFAIDFCVFSIVSLLPYALTYLILRLSMGLLITNNSSRWLQWITMFLTSSPT